MNPSIGLDYFSILPPAYDQSFLTGSSLHSPEPTPPGFSDLLSAHRRLPFDVLSDMSSTAMKSNVTRPRPVPIQNMLQVTSDDSSDCSSSNSSYSPLASPLELARCSRCQRTPSLDIKTGKSNMVQYGLNLWYCNRCAALVGWSKG